ncbi:DUF5610 domain-containing protein [Amphritea sp. HPY]|uniref:DUF5610 domain-containing protein n=1 Tax=Amphritea sp. HPY TaxID=3421652 RepID=UPI003D7EF1C2
MDLTSVQGQPVGSRTAETQQNRVQTQPTQSKTEQNQSILQASLKVSISSGNDSLTLLYRSAVNELNQVLEADLGSNAIDEAYSSGIDVSPDATAERIVSLSTAFFSSYQEQHPEMDLETQLNSFVELISSGIDQGFSEAREILDGLQVLEGDIAANIDTTYELVQNKLTAFLDTLLQSSVTETTDDTVSSDA